MYWCLCIHNVRVEYEKKKIHEHTHKQEKLTRVDLLVSMCAYNMQSSPTYVLTLFVGICVCMQLNF